MKVTRKYVLDQLKDRFEGVDEKVLVRIANKIAKTAKDEDDATTKVEEMTLQSVIDAYADSRATEASDSAVKNYEEKYGLQEGKIVKKPKATKTEESEEEEEEEEENNGGGGMPKWFKAYSEAADKKTQALLDEIAALKGEKVQNSRKAKLEALLEGVDDKVKNQYLKSYTRMNFKDDADFESYLEEITPDIEEIQANPTPKPGVVGGPKGGGGKPSQKVNPLLQARVDARTKAVQQTSAIQGLGVIQQ